MRAPDRRAKLDCDHPLLSVRWQCAMLGIARSGVYRLPRPANDDDLKLLRRIDELFTRWPFLGSRRMTAMLGAEGQAINRKRVQRLMRRMGSEPSPDEWTPRVLEGARWIDDDEYDDARSFTDEFNGRRCRCWPRAGDR
jgi:hypothetical protein